jgi:hypothetical protein
MAELFAPFKRIPMNSEDLEFAVIANSEAISIGDAVTPGTTTSVNQFVKGAKATATSKVLGVVQGFRPISTSSTNLTAEQSSFTAGSANQTTGGSYGVVYWPARLTMKWVATLDNPTGTTTGSGAVGLFNMSTGVNGLTEASFVLTGNGASGTISNLPASFSSIGSASGYGMGYSTSQVIGFFNLFV